jgi:hypothetical protein
VKALAAIALTLVASGPISIYDIADEFQLAHNAIWPGAFYGLGGAPASGALALRDFYGRSNVIFTPDGGSVSASATGTVAITLTCNKAATWTFSPPAGVSYSVNPGAAATSIRFSQNLQTDGTLSFDVRGVSGNVTRDFTLNLTSRSPTEPER